MSFIDAPIGIVDSINTMTILAVASNTCRDIKTYGWRSSIWAGSGVTECVESLEDRLR